MPATLTVIASVRTLFLLKNANGKPIGNFEEQEQWCGLSRLVEISGSGSLVGETIIVYTPDPFRPGEPLEIVKCTAKVRDAIQCFSPAG